MIQSSSLRGKLQQVTNNLKKKFIINIGVSGTLMTTLFFGLSTIELLKELNLYGDITTLSLESHLAHNGEEDIDMHVSAFLKQSSKSLKLAQPQILTLINSDGDIIASNIKPWVGTRVNAKSPLLNLGSKSRLTSAYQCLNRQCKDFPNGINWLDNSFEYVSIFGSKYNKPHLHSAHSDQKYILYISFFRDDIAYELLRIFLYSFVVAFTIVIIVNAFPYYTVIRKTLPEYYSVLQIDKLSGLSNRSIFVEESLNILSNAEDSNTDYIFAIIDVDNFKEINDNYGHGAGDFVIMQMGSIISELIRDEVDLACRFGGEEFALLLQLDAKSSEQILERLRYQVELNTRRYDSYEIAFTISIGAIATKTHGYNFDYLVKRADKALYTAKAYGKNNVVWVVDL